MAKRRLRRNPDADQVCFFCGEIFPETDSEFVFISLIDPDDYDNVSTWGSHSSCVADAVHPSIFFVNPATGAESGPGT
jgi:hypothetical protein